MLQPVRVVVKPMGVRRTQITELYYYFKIRSNNDQYVVY